MFRKYLISIILLSFISTISYGSFYKSSFNSRSSIVASVEIENKGIYNLVVSIEFLSTPFDKREYESDEYKYLIHRLNLEWQGVVMNKVLESNIYKVTDLAALEAVVKEKVRKLININRTTYGVSEELEVVFSITNFYLLKPNNE